MSKAEMENTPATHQLEQLLSQEAYVYPVWYGLLDTEGIFAVLPVIPYKARF